MINQSIISPSCEINSPSNKEKSSVKQKSGGSNHHPLNTNSRKLEVTEFDDYKKNYLYQNEFNQNQISSALNQASANEHQRKIFSFKLGPTGKKTSLGETRYEDVQNFMSQESFTQKEVMEVLRSDKAFLSRELYQDSKAASNLQLSSNDQFISPNWKTAKANTSQEDDKYVILCHSLMTKR